MKKAILLSVFMTFGVQAQGSNQPSGDLIKELGKVDQAVYCVYDNKLYTEGSVIKMSQSDKVCKKVYGASPKRLAWQ